ncbi:MAG TPA: extracellular solute-binding protein [Clostridia bacterium]|nr:extracellular solute-binding protein [Clostridia bacterium]
MKEQAPIFTKKLFSVIILIVLILVALSTSIYLLAKPQQRDVQQTSAGQAGLGTDEKKSITFAFRKVGTDEDMENSVIEYNNSVESPVEVKMLKIPDDKYDETLNMYLTSGEAPDVFEIGSEWLDTYVTKDWVRDLSNYCSEEFLSAFPGWTDRFMHEKYSAEGLYSLPASQTTIRLVYNRSLFEMAGLDPDSPPETLDELKSYALKISKTEIGNKKYGFALSAGDGRKCFEQFMESANTCNGVYYYDFRNGQYDLGVYEKWLQTIRQMKENESLFPGETILKGSNALMQFREGNIGMMYMTSASLKMLAGTDGTDSQPDWDTAMPPAFDRSTAGKGKVSIIPSTFYCVSNTSGNIEESVGFWKYLYSYEHMGEMFRNGNAIPVMKEVYSDTAYKSKINGMDNFLPGNQDSVFPVAPAIINDWSRVESYMEAIEGTNTVGQVLKNETENLNYQFNLIIDGGLVNSNDYAHPDFDWLDPLKRQ